MTTAGRKRREPSLAIAKAGEGAPAVAGQRSRSGGRGMKPISDMNAAERAWVLSEADREGMGPFFRNFLLAMLDAKALFDAAYGKGMDGVQYIRRNPPSAETIMFLMTMAHENITRMQARAGAAKSNAAHDEAREYVQTMWVAHRDEFESKTKFAEAYRDQLKRERGRDVTVKTIVDRWLKGM